jgi:hypothetical protein
LSGTTTFDGTPPGGTTIKLAGFYSKQNQSGPRIIVSNVATATDGGEFSLYIDASDLNPVDYDDIELKMWEDDNNNDLVDPGERDYYTEPAPGGCPVFGDEGYCQFEWHDKKSRCISEYDKGWNVEKRIYNEEEGLSCTSESVDTTVLDGARITNSWSF